MNEKHEKIQMGLDSMLPYPSKYKMGIRNKRIMSKVEEKEDLYKMVCDYKSYNDQNIEDLLEKVADCLKKREQDKEMPFLYRQIIFFICVEVLQRKKKEKKKGKAKRKVDSVKDVLTYLQKNGRTGNIENLFSNQRYQPGDYVDMKTYVQPEVLFPYMGQKTGSNAEALRNVIYQAGGYQRFVDLFGGSGAASVAFPEQNRKRKKVEYIYNEKHRELYQLFLCLQDDQYFEKMCKCINLLISETFYERNKFEAFNFDKACNSYLSENKYDNWKQEKEARFVLQLTDGKYENGKCADGKYIGNQNTSEKKCPYAKFCTIAYVYDDEIEGIQLYEGCAYELIYTYSLEDLRNMFQELGNWIQKRYPGGARKNFYCKGKRYKGTEYEEKKYSREALLNYQQTMYQKLCNETNEYAYQGKIWELYDQLHLDSEGGIAMMAFLAGEPAEKVENISIRAMMGDETFLFLRLPQLFSLRKEKIRQRFMENYAILAICRNQTDDIMVEKQLALQGKKMQTNPSNKATLKASFIPTEAGFEYFYQSLFRRNTHDMSQIKKMYAIDGKSRSNVVEKFLEEDTEGKLQKYHEIFRNRICTNYDFEEAIRKFDGEDVLFYSDSPYLESSGYKDEVNGIEEFTPEEMKRLIHTLMRCEEENPAQGKKADQMKGKFIFSCRASSGAKNGGKISKYVEHLRKKEGEVNPEDTKQAKDAIRKHYEKNISIQKNIFEEFRNLAQAQGKEIYVMSLSGDFETDMREGKMTEIIITNFQIVPFKMTRDRDVKEEDEEKKKEEKEKEERWTTVYSIREFCQILQTINKKFQDMLC